MGIKDILTIQSQNEYIGKLSDAIIKYKKIYKICFAIQNDDVIIREFKDIASLKKKDINGYIKYQIFDYLPINVSNYILKYKIFNRKKDKMDLQIVLFPKHIKEICESVVNKTKIKRKSLNINFDIIQKLIDYEIIKYKTNSFFIMQNEAEQIILHSVKGNIVENSSIFEKDPNSDEIVGFLNENKSILSYGIKDIFLENLMRSGIEIKDLDINKKIKVQGIEKNIYDNLNKYLIHVGMVV